MTGRPLRSNMRREYFLKDPSRIELMPDIHNRIMRAIIERDTDKAIRELDINFDIQIGQIYNRNDDSNHDIQTTGSKERQQIKGVIAAIFF
jgi:hypothetical protein